MFDTVSVLLIVCVRDPLGVGRWLFVREPDELELFVCVMVPEVLFDCVTVPDEDCDADRVPDGDVETLPVPDCDRDDDLLGDDPWLPVREIVWLPEQVMDGVNDGLVERVCDWVGERVGEGLPDGVALAVVVVVGLGLPDCVALDVSDLVAL